MCAAVGGVRCAARRKLQNRARVRRPTYFQQTVGIWGGGLPVSAHRTRDGPSSPGTTLRRPERTTPCARDKAPPPLQAAWYIHYHCGHALKRRGRIVWAALLSSCFAPEGTRAGKVIWATLKRTQRTNERLQKKARNRQLLYHVCFVSSERGNELKNVEERGSRAEGGDRTTHCRARGLFPPLLSGERLASAR